MNTLKAKKNQESEESQLKLLKNIVGITAIDPQTET
jgi:hypothetical protein